MKMEATIITIIFFSFSIGAFLGALWMFFAMLKSIEKTQEELDSKNEQLEQLLETNELQKYYNSL
ncbi:MAG TPA: hypothetical protein DEG69_13985 [Flavobacteriaceae bacterium]|nr:hypothetical protein [Flavobacteriaceae bacterium]